ncbi:MAG: hypothetical protein IPJ30_10050 [Acidobacteria bacterium]|nr:hypothetical protein [Acidobacteriota bacterium]
MTEQPQIFPYWLYLPHLEILPDPFRTDRFVNVIDKAVPTCRPNTFILNGAGQFGNIIQFECFENSQFVLIKRNFQNTTFRRQPNLLRSRNTDISVLVDFAANFAEVFGRER